MCWSFTDMSFSSSPPCPTHFLPRVSLPAALHVSHDQAIFSVSVSLWALGPEGGIGVAGATTVLGTQEEEGNLCCVDARPGRVGETPPNSRQGVWMPDARAPHEKRTGTSLLKPWGHCVGPDLLLEQR